MLNPSFIFKRIFDQQSIENPKNTLNLNHYLHPTLDPAAQWLEHSILRLQAATENVLSRHGAQILDKQVDIQRLSVCAIQIYAMFASIARSSRAYCIGLQHSDYEMLIASSLSFEGMTLIKKISLDIRDGPFVTSDSHYQKIAKQLFKNKSYFPAHPLTRNF